MIIQRSTLYQAGIAIAFFAVVVVLFTIAVGLIRQDGQQLSNQFAAMTEQTNREAAVIQLRRTADDTEEERAEIADAFLPGEGAAVAFLSELEQAAPRFGVGIEILTLAKAPEAETTSWLVISLSVSGSYEAVAKFIAYLETLPYRSYVSTALLTSREGTAWSAEVELLISERAI